MVELEYQADPPAPNLGKGVIVQRGQILAIEDHFA